MAAILTVGCTGKDGQNLSDIPDGQVINHSDSLVFAARKTGDFNRVPAVIDSLADAGDFSPIHADNYRCEPYFFLGQTEKSLECLRCATADNNPPAEDFWFYINCGVNLAMLQDGLSDHEGAISTALRFIGELQQVKSPYRANGLKSFYFFLGNAQMNLERHAEAAESFNEAYRWLRLLIENDSTGSLMPGTMLTLDNTAIAYFGIQQPDEAEKWVNREDSLLAIYRQNPKADSTEMEVFRAYILLDRAKICQARGQQDQADRYYAEYTQTDRGKETQGYIFGAHYLMQAHRYADAADVYQQLDHYLGSYGFDYNLEIIGDEMFTKFYANYYAGRKDSALQVAMKIAEVYDSALVMQKRSDAANLATLYDVQGKERQIVEQRAGKRLFTAISIASGILGLLVLAFAVYVFRQWRTTKEKNRILAQQITEAVEYRKSLTSNPSSQGPRSGEFAIHQQGEGNSKSPDYDSRIANLAKPDTGEAVSISDFTMLTDEQLFLCLRDLIENEQLFLQPDFGRQALIDYTGLSKDRIGAAFAQGSDSRSATIEDACLSKNSLPAYVRDLRLDYAVRLMNDQPDLTVELVSQASGFTSADTFTRNFRTKYGMTPTAYRQTK